MKKGSLAALFIVALLAATALIPASHASNITVVLNPNDNTATMNAYINSSLSISANSTSFIGELIANNIISGITAGNLTINQTSQNRGSPAFEILNSSISSIDPGAQLDSLAMSYKRTVNNATAGDEVTFYSNTSLKIALVVSGVFHNNSANLSWRSFSTNQSITLNGTDVSQVNFNRSNIPTLISINTVDMHVFAKSLDQWNRSYDPTSNVTTFSLNAGNTIYVSYGNKTQPGGFNLTYVLDPSFSISIPGYATASADSLTIGNPPSTNPAVYYGMGAIFLAIVLIPMILRRRRFR